VRDPRITHGRKGYIYHHCRCDICVTTHRNYQREYYRKRRAEAREGGRPFHGTQPRVIADTYLGLQPCGEWSEQAACKGKKDWEIAEKAAAWREPHRQPNVVRAIAICHTCPVLEQCRNWVLAHQLDPCPVHVVAGMTPKERNAHRRSQGIAVPGGKQRGDAA
jgi:WhiB family redox-sensing transcriptional regulator